MDKIRWLPFPIDDKQVEAEIRESYNEFVQTKTGEKAIEIGYYGTVAILFANYYIKQKTTKNDKDTRQSVPRVPRPTVYGPTGQRENSFGTDDKTGKPLPG